MRLAIWDMDRTVTRRASWTAWLLFFARTERPARLLLLPLLALPALLYLFGRDRARLKQRTHRLLMGRRVPRATVARAAQAFAARFGPRQELPAALGDIAARRAAGDRLWLATASSAFYAEALARRWGMDRCIATANIWDGDSLTPRIAGENCYAEGKLRMILAALTERPAHVRFATDDASDLPTLLWADDAIAANPGPALRQAARARGWTVCDWASAGPRTAPAGSPDTPTAPTGSPSRGR